MGNVNKTYKVNFLRPDGTPKSYLLQNVNTYAFRDPVGLMEKIDGDLYFNTKYPGHNLVRTRCQIALAKDMLKKMDEMNAIVRNCVEKAK